MRTRKTISGLFAASLFIGTAVASQDYEQNVEKTFQVTPGGRLILQADRGSVDVKTDESNQVQVHVYRKVSGGSKSNAGEQFANHELTLTQDGNRVVVIAKNKTNKLFSWGRQTMDVHYVISIPKKFDAELKTAGGNIQVADLRVKRLLVLPAAQSSLAIFLENSTSQMPAGTFT
jgi:hypothetical protein